MTSKPGDPSRLRLLTRGSWPEAKRLTDVLRRETVGGVLLLIAGGVALGWANSPWAASYRAVSEFSIGPESLHLHLNLATWAADGLLAIFFFVVGLELKREFVAGDLRDPARAVLPIAAAIGGMIVPAGIFVGIDLLDGQPENLGGWAVPIATDIAFALGGARRPVDAPADRTAYLPADARRRRRPAWRSPSSPPSTPTTCRSGRLALALIPGVAFAVAVHRGVRRLVAAGAAWRWRRGGSCMRAVSTRRSREWCSDSRCRCSDDTPSPSTSSTRCVRCRRVSRCRCSHSSPRASRSVAGTAWRDSLTASRDARRARRASDRQTARCVRHHVPVGTLHRRRIRRGPGLAGRTRGWHCWPASGSPCRY